MRGDEHRVGLHRGQQRLGFGRFLPDPQEQVGVLQARVPSVSHPGLLRSRSLGPEDTSPPFDKQATIRIIQWKIDNEYIDIEGLPDKFLFDKNGNKKQIINGKVKVCFNYLYNQWMRYLAYWNNKYSGYSSNEERFIKAENKLMSFQEFISNDEKNYWKMNWGITIKYGKREKWLIGNRTFKEAFELFINFKNECERRKNYAKQKR